MDGRLPYDYRELAYDLYHAEDQLLEELVSLRAQRGMTQKQLADEMCVSQSYVSQIENGRKKLVTLLTDYALEVGARITYSVEPAELKPEGGRKYDTWKAAQQMQVTSEWSNGDITVGAINIEIKVSRQKPDHDGPHKVTVMGASGKATPWRANEDMESKKELVG